MAANRDKGSSFWYRGDRLLYMGDGLYYGLVSGEYRGGGGSSAGVGINGEGLNGVYYDWFTNSYSSVADGSSVSWDYAFSYAVEPNLVYNKEGEGAYTRDYIRRHYGYYISIKDMSIPVQLDLSSFLPLVLPLPEDTFQNQSDTNPNSKEDYLVFNGKQVVWYNGDGGFVASYKAVSGGLDFQNKKYQNQKPGPIPEGAYTINLSLNPNRVATRYEGNLFYNDVGIMKVPNWMKVQSLNPWGNTMARLEPVKGTNLWGRENNFYMHDSNKGYTSGCIEVQSSFFARLLDYRQSNPSIMLFVFY